jgi:hypothetical protein
MSAQKINSTFPFHKHYDNSQINNVSSWLTHDKMAAMYDCKKQSRESSSNSLLGLSKVPYYDSQSGISNPPSGRKVTVYQPIIDKIKENQ